MSQTRTQSVPPPSMRPGGVVAGKYRIEAPLGEGGMGTVWAATHVELGQRVALKLISSELARSADLLARFKAEAKAAAQLQSRYVVRMYDSGVTEDGRPYIAMEYLTGESLEDRLNRIGSLPLAATVRIVSQVCKALKLAHAQNIIHRDLKPANIFLATTGDDEEIAKVLDFGIAKVMHHEQDQGATATGIILGTPLYMSPEQARALKTLDHRTDLYSLGMVTYRMLVGDPPFHGESFGDLVYSICTRPLPSIHEQVPAIPPALDAWFHRACAKDQDARFATADQMREALHAASGLSAGQLHVDTGGHTVPSRGVPLRLDAPSGGFPAGLVDSHARAAMTGSEGSQLATQLGPVAHTHAGTAAPLRKSKGSGWAIGVSAGVFVAAGAVAAFLWLGRSSDDGTGGSPSPVLATAGPVPLMPEANAAPGDPRAPGQNAAPGDPRAQSASATESANGAARLATNEAPIPTATVNPPLVTPSPSGLEEKPEPDPATAGDEPKPGRTLTPPRTKRPGPGAPAPEGQKAPQKPPPGPGKTATPDLGF